MRYLQIEDLQAEEISYLVQAFANISTDSKAISDQDEISKFIPKLLVHTQNELYRYNMADIVTMLNGYFKLWDVGALEKAELARVHEFC